MGRAPIVDARALSGPAKGIVGEEQECFCQAPPTGALLSFVRTMMYVNNGLSDCRDYTWPRKRGQGSVVRDQWSVKQAVSDEVSGSTS